MLDCVLLVSLGEPVEMVTAFNHAYPVVDGCVEVDVRRYREPVVVRNDEGKEVTVRGEPHADAAVDAAEICRHVDVVDVGGMRQAVYKFRPASEAEVAAWRAKRGEKPAKAEK